jgi:5-methylcytosine-specific restriction endonuclease McrA
MKKISKPTIKAKDVFLDCISTVANATLKQQYEDCAGAIEIAETDFENKFPNHQIFQIVQNLVVHGNIGKDEMKPVYNYRMVKSGMPGNKYYNQIKSLSPYGKCPLCSVRGVDTLDHYLPKSKYPVFAVTPINLIPACTPCNKGKHIDFPATSAEQTLHPYYDNVEDESWIKANILQTSPISFEYYVDCPAYWSQVLKDRSKNHFDSFNLNELFSSHANDELRGAKKYLMKLYNHDPNILHDHLVDAYYSILELGINSWKAVMYNALKNDLWFCNGGVLL